MDEYSGDTHNKEGALQYHHISNPFETSILEQRRYGTAAHTGKHTE
jgi:hypothetical protein